MNTCDLFEFTCVQDDLAGNFLNVQYTLMERYNKSGNKEAAQSAHLNFFPGTAFYITFYPSIQKYLFTFFTTDSKSIVSCLTSLKASDSQSGTPIRDLVDKFVKLRNTCNKEEYLDLASDKWFPAKNLLLDPGSNSCQQKGEPTVTKL